MKLYAAPIQGYTEAIWRNLHEEMFGGIEAYYTPFLRLEKNQIRNKDAREIKAENNTVNHLVPQIIAATASELRELINWVESNGYQEVDINLGCPFPPIALKHRGAGLLPYPEEVKSLLTELKNHPTIRFSIKMRLGMNEADEWKGIIDTLNETPLERVILHPRIAKQQYTGEVNIEACKEFADACHHPFVYNGDVQSLEDIARTEELFPKAEGIMIGRGLLAQPFLSAEYKEQRIWSEKEKKNGYKEFHRRLFQEMSSWLTGGETQVLSKMKPYWEYLYPEMDKKVRKAIHKANSLEKYMSAVNGI